MRHASYRLITACSLQEKNMHEVATGGLSSYSLINMVIAHLQAEGYVMTQDGHQLQAGVGDLGNLLWGFLMRYGDIFDYYDHAISIVQVSTPASCITISLLSAHRTCLVATFQFYQLVRHRLTSSCSESRVMTTHDLLTLYRAQVSASSNLCLSSAESKLEPVQDCLLYNVPSCFCRVE